MLTASAVFAQTPYQQISHKSKPDAAVQAVPTQNGAVPTFTFRKAEVAPEAVAAPATTIPVQSSGSAAATFVFVAPGDGQAVQPVMMAPPQPVQPARPVVHHAAVVALPQQPVTPMIEAPQAIEMPSVMAIAPPPVMMIPTVEPAPASERTMVIPPPRVFVPVVFQAAPVTSAIEPPDSPPSRGPADEKPDEAMTLQDLGIETQPPSADRLYRLETEAQLRSRITEEIKKRPRGDQKIVFPTYGPLTEDRYKPRAMGGVIKQIEPNYVVYGRLYGEQLNAERYGWELGAIHPIVSAAVAFKDIAITPYNFATRPCQRQETSAGRCYPGDPVPFLIYPIEVSATGATFQTIVTVAGYALIP